MMAPTLPFLALGDSYTIGEGVAADARWTHQLAASLRDAGIPLADPYTIATTGWTTGGLLQALADAAAQRPWALVSLLIGVNNQYRGLSLHEYQRNFAALLQQAITLADHRPDRVLALSIPDWGVTPFATASGRDRNQIATELDAFNAAACTICQQQGVAWVDITPLSRQFGADASMLAADALHPSAAQYSLWMQAALPTARALLTDTAPPNATPR